MSFLARLARRIRSPTSYVGRDLEGNRFYEYASVSDDPRRTKRVVKYAHSEDVHAHISGLRRLPVQWTAWLTHTRPHPPTVEELQADLARQQRVLHNAAVLEARDRAEAALRHRIPDAEGTTTASVTAPEERSAALEGAGSADTGDVAPAPAPMTADARNWPRAAESGPQPSPWKTPLADEPESWNPPVGIRRRG